MNLPFLATNDLSFFVQEAKAAIQKLIEERLQQQMQVPADLQNLTKELADKSKNTLKGLNKDGRYKYCVQVIVG